MGEVPRALDGVTYHDGMYIMGNIFHLREESNLRRNPETLFDVYVGCKTHEVGQPGTYEKLLTVKKLRGITRKPDEKNIVLSELKSLLPHPNVANILAATDHKAGLFFATDFFPLGTMKEYFDAMRTMDSRVRLKLSADLMRGFKYLHMSDPKIVHCRFSPSCAVMEESMVNGSPVHTAKLGEISFCKIVARTEREALDTFTSTQQLNCFQAPEVFMKPQASACESDIFSAGMTILGIMDHSKRRTLRSHQVNTGTPNGQLLNLVALIPEGSDQIIDKFINHVHFAEDSLEWRIKSGILREMIVKEPEGRCTAGDALRQLVALEEEFNVAGTRYPDSSTTDEKDRFKKKWERYLDKHYRPDAVNNVTPTSDQPGLASVGPPGAVSVGPPGAAISGLPGAVSSGLQGAASSGLPGAASSGLPGAASSGQPIGTSIGRPSAASSGRPGAAISGQPGQARVVAPVSSGQSAHVSSGQSAHVSSGQSARVSSGRPGHGRSNPLPPPAFSANAAGSRQGSSTSAAPPAGGSRGNAGADPRSSGNTSTTVRGRPRNRTGAHTASTAAGTGTGTGAAARGGTGAGVGTGTGAGARGGSGAGVGTDVGVGAGAGARGGAGAGAASNARGGAGAGTGPGPSGSGSGSAGSRAGATAVAGSGSTSTGSGTDNNNGTSIGTRGNVDTGANTMVTPQQPSDSSVTHAPVPVADDATTTTGSSSTSGGGSGSASSSVTTNAGGPRSVSSSTGTTVAHGSDLDAFDIPEITSDQGHGLQYAGGNRGDIRLNTHLSPTRRDGRAQSASQPPDHGATPPLQRSESEPSPSRSQGASNSSSSGSTPTARVAGRNLPTPPTGSTPPSGETSDTECVTLGSLGVVLEETGQADQAVLLAATAGFSPNAAPPATGPSSAPPHTAPAVAPNAMLPHNDFDRDYDYDGHGNFMDDEGLGDIQDEFHDADVGFPGAVHVDNNVDSGAPAVGSGRISAAPRGGGGDDRGTGGGTYDRGAGGGTYDRGAGGGTYDRGAGGGDDRGAGGGTYDRGAAGDGGPVSSNIVSSWMDANPFTMDDSMMTRVNKGMDVHAARRLCDDRHWKRLQAEGYKYRRRIYNNKTLSEDVKLTADELLNRKDDRHYESLERESQQIQGLYANQRLVLVEPDDEKLDSILRDHMFLYRKLPQKEPVNRSFYSEQTLVKRTYGLRGFVHHVDLDGHVCVEFPGTSGASGSSETIRFYYPDQALTPLDKKDPQKKQEGREGDMGYIQKFKDRDMEKLDELNPTQPLTDEIFGKMVEVTTGGSQTLMIRFKGQDYRVPANMFVLVGTFAECNEIHTRLATD